MTEREEARSWGLAPIHDEMLSLLRESAAGQRWVWARQHKIWRPPTDVYETDDCVVVKVEIAGMVEEDLAISLQGKKLLIGGVRHDAATKLGYQQMEILYGRFETEVYLPRSIDDEGIEATYQDGFLYVRLPKAQPRQVPVTNPEESA